MSTNLVFKNRQSENPNRRRLTIVEQQGNEMLVDVERADTNVTEEGTPINADVLNQWNNIIDESNSKSTNAVNTATQANTMSNNALSKATTAETNANDARNYATSALNQVNALVREIDINQINGTGSPSVSFVNNPDGTKKFSFKNLKGVKGDTGNPAGFGAVDAVATALPIGGTPYANISTNGPDTSKNIHFDFGLPAGIQGERGEKGDCTYVRYSFDKTTMTEEKTDNSIYIGFYNGITASDDPNDYTWSRMWGAQSIRESDYANLLRNDTLNPEQIYFIEGVDGDDLHVYQSAQEVSFDDTQSNLNAQNIQQAIDNIKAREFSKSYNDLIDKPFIPTSYESLTDKPVIPTNASFTLTGLSEKSYDSLTDKPFIPNNASFTLAGLAEKSYNSLTDKPTIPVVDKLSIASALGLDQNQLEQLIALAKKVNVTEESISFNTNSINVQE